MNYLRAIEPIRGTARNKDKDHISMKPTNSQQLPNPDTPINLVFLGALYLSELCALLVFMSTYRLAYKKDVLDFLFSSSGYLFLAGILGLVASSVGIIHQVRKSRDRG